MKQTYDNCFVCGSKNPYGLKIDFTCAEGKAWAAFSLKDYYEGYDGIIHGGIIAALLDEAMAKAILCNNIKAVTVDLSVGYKKPLKPGEKYHVEGSIKVLKRKTILAEAFIADESSLYAKGEAKFFILEERK